MQVVGSLSGRFEMSSGIVRQLSDRAAPSRQPLPNSYRPRIEHRRAIVKTSISDLPIDCQQDKSQKLAAGGSYCLRRSDLIRGRIAEALARNRAACTVLMFRARPWVRQRTEIRQHLANDACVEAEPTTPGAEPDALALALTRSEQVQAKVEECADDLASANDLVKSRLAEGATVAAAQAAVTSTEKVESKVRESVVDLGEVNESLAQGLDDLKRAEAALSTSRTALAETEADLAATRQRALHDPATQLPNRELFDDRLTHAIAMAERHSWTLAVMFLDLDRFKSINDTHGHSAGDDVLKAVARRLQENCREEDTVCRNGGDEFLYLLVDPKGADNVRKIAKQILVNIELPISVGDRPFVVKASIGIAIYPDNGMTGEQLVRNADRAMYRAKQQKDGAVAFFAPE